MHSLVQYHSWLAKGFVLCTIGQWMPYNFAAESFRTKELCSRLSSTQSHFYAKNGHFAFFSPPSYGLRATYDVHLRLIGKRVRDNWTFFNFFARCYGWGATSQILIAVFEGGGSVCRATFHLKGDAPIPTMLCLAKQNTSTFHTVYECEQKFLSFCYNSRIWQTDGRTDTLLVDKTALHSMQRDKSQKWSKVILPSITSPNDHLCCWVIPTKTHC